MSWQFYAEDLNYIAKVTELLNTLPESKNFYVHIELREEGTHTKAGAWSDEISHDAWSFSDASNAVK